MQLTVEGQGGDGSSMRSREAATFDGALRAFSVSLHLLLALVVLALVGVAFATASPLRTLLESPHLHPGVLLGFVAAGSAVVVGSRVLPPGRSDLLVSAVLGVMYATIASRPGMGDGSWKMLSTDGTRELWTSSYLSHLLLRWLYLVFEDVRFYAPVLGFLTALLTLRCLRAVFRDARRPAYVLTRFVYLAVGLHLIFFADFVETTMPSVVVALLGLPALLRYAGDAKGMRDERQAVRDIALATGCLVLAACFHGQFVVVFPVVALVAASRLLSAVPVKQVVREAATAVGTAVGVVVAVFLVTIPLLGYEAVTGDATGGFDDRRWAVDFFGVAHAQVAGSAVAVAAVGSVVGALALPLVVARRGRLGDPVPSATLALLGLAYVGFVSSWGYDLGFPRDADLMLSLGAIAVPAFAFWTEAAAAAASRRIIGSAVLVATLFQVVVTSTLLRA